MSLYLPVAHQPLMWFLPLRNPLAGDKGIFLSYDRTWCLKSSSTPFPAKDVRPKANPAAQFPQNCNHWNPSWIPIEYLSLILIIDCLGHIFLCDGTSKNLKCRFFVQTHTGLSPTCLYSHSFYLNVFHIVCPVYISPMSFPEVPEGHPQMYIKWALLPVQKYRQLKKKPTLKTKTRKGQLSLLQRECMHCLETHKQQ